MKLFSAGEARLDSVHFWGHTLGLPVMMLSLGMLLYGANGAPTNPDALYLGDRVSELRRRVRDS